MGLRQAWPDPGRHSGEQPEKSLEGTPRQGMEATEPDEFDSTGGDNVQFQGVFRFRLLKTPFGTDGGAELEEKSLENERDKMKI